MQCKKQSLMLIYAEWVPVLVEMTALFNSVNVVCCQVRQDWGSPP